MSIATNINRNGAPLSNSSLEESLPDFQLMNIAIEVVVIKSMIQLVHF